METKKPRGAALCLIRGFCGLTSDLHPCKDVTLHNIIARHSSIVSCNIFFQILAYARSVLCRYNLCFLLIFA